MTLASNIRDGAAQPGGATCPTTGDEQAAACQTAYATATIFQVGPTPAPSASLPATNATQSLHRQLEAEEHAAAARARHVADIHQMQRQRNQQSMSSDMQALQFLMRNLPVMV